MKKNIQEKVNKILHQYGHTEMGLYKIQLLFDEQEAGKWLPVTEDLKREIQGEVVMGYSPEWVDEDYNRRGIRECFTCDAEEGDWTSMKWCGYHDDWHCDNDTAPTHILIIPKTPNE